MAYKIRKNKQSYAPFDIYQNYDKRNCLLYSIFRNIVDKLFSNILSLLYSGDSFKLPYNLGFILIIKYKPKHYNGKSLSIDYKTSKELNKKVYFLNEHSNGYKFRLYWSKIPFSFANRYKYQLCFTRNNKKQLALLIFNNKDYLDINDIQLYNM